MLDPMPWSGHLARTDAPVRRHLVRARDAEARADLVGAVEAYEAALASDPTESRAHLGLGKVAKRLVRHDRSPATEAILERAFARSRGPAALERFRREHGGATVVASVPILVGAGSAHVVRHTLRPPTSGSTAPVPERDVVQKVTVNDGEVAALRFLEQVQSHVPEGIAFPRVLGIVAFEGVTHVFFECVDFEPGQVRRRDLERVGELLAAVSHLSGAAAASELSTFDLSAPVLASALDEIRSSAACVEACRADDSVPAMLDQLGQRIPAIADVLADAPRVFAHNDANRNNLMPVRDDGGRVDSLMLIDWGRAGRNVVGAELYWLLLHVRPGQARFARLVDGYLRGVAPVPGVERVHVELGALGYAIVRLGMLAKRNVPWRGRARAVAWLGRRTLATAAGVSG